MPLLSLARFITIGLSLAVPGLLGRSVGGMTVQAICESMLGRADRYNDRIGVFARRVFARG